LRRYTFSQKCTENDKLQLDDKAIRIFFSTTDIAALTGLDEAEVKKLSKTQ
jgi:hypothetical protein